MHLQFADYFCSIPGAFQERAFASFSVEPIGGLWAMDAVLWNVVAPLLFVQ